MHNIVKQQGSSHSHKDDFVKLSSRAEQKSFWALVTLVLGILWILAAVRPAEAQVFDDIKANLPGVFDSSAAWGDFDNDGDLDVLLTGWSDSGFISKVYRNDGHGIFTDIGAVLTGVYGSSVAWGDYDNDGDLDILLTGYTGSFDFTGIYRNDGSGIFTDINARLPGTFFGSVAWGDYDNDGDLDILLAGWGPLSKIFRNDGGDHFSDIGANLAAVGNASVAWGDYDNDGDLDILLSGSSNAGRITRIYSNDGNGVFTDIGANLTGVEWGSVAWGDYDNDGDLDIVLTGSVDINTSIAIIYRNDGSGVFTDIGANLTSVYHSSVAWGDYDNNGDLDILLTGFNPSSGNKSKIYRNDGNDVFSEIGTSVTPANSGSASWGDFDNDGDLDILQTGFSGDGGISKIYRHFCARTNTSPASPTGLTANQDAGQINLSWTAATDSQTPSAGLTYNLRVSTSPGGVNILSPMASTTTGWRKLPQLGNVQLGTSTVLKSLPAGTYYWSVQAIDTAFAGSPFAPESTIINDCATIDPGSTNVSGSGGTGSVSVSGGTECHWNAASNNPWITVTPPGNGSGNGSIGYTVAANTGAGRVGTITIGTRTFTVNQALATFTLTVNKEGPGGGTVTSAPTGISCGSTCTADYDYNTVVTLTAVAAPDSIFTDWTGAGCSGTDTCEVTMDEARSVTATFSHHATAYYPLTPCRVFDTRNASGAPILDPDSTRSFTLVGTCGIPAAAKAIAANITVVNASATGDISIIAGSLTSTPTSTIQVPLSRARANNAAIQLATDGSGTIAVINRTSGTVHLILDVNGYFQ